MTEKRRGARGEKRARIFQLRKLYTGLKDCIKLEIKTNDGEKKGSERGEKSENIPATEAIHRAQRLH